MNKIKVLFILIIILSAALRIFYLGKIPNGFYSDEASYGYNAYSILKTGRDEYSNFLPLAFKSFGDYKAPLYIYFLVPFIGLLGLTEFAVRFSSVLLGTGSIILIYYLAKELFKDKSIALLSSFLASVTPFTLQFNRMAHENNLVVFLILLGLLFFVKSLKNSRYIIVSIISFILSIYAYHDARVFTPLLLFALLIIYRKYLYRFKKALFFNLTLSIIMSIPFLNLMRNEAFWSRPRFTILSSDPGISLRINEGRGEDLVSSYPWPGLFHNKIISYGLTFTENYMKHFSFDFLYLSGDPVKIYQTAGNGILYIIFLPFLIYGLYYIFKNYISHKWLMIVWLVLSPIPSAMTRFVPSASRMLIILPILSILSAIGLISCFRFIRRLRLKHLTLLFISILFVFNMSYYLHYYYFNTQVKYAKEWHYGMAEVMRTVVQKQGMYSQVWFSKNAWGYIYPLFYLKYPPAEYQQQAKLSSLNEFGFGWVSSFDKYIFADIPDREKWSPSILYIGSVDDFPDIKKPLYAINYPDGRVAFYLADMSSF